MHRFIIALILVALCMPSRAAEESVPAELAALQAKQARAAQTIAAAGESKIKRANADYLAALDEFRRGVTANGDLDGVLAAKAEIERVKANRVTTEAHKKSMPAVLLKKREAYDAGVMRLVTDMQRQQTAQQGLYARELELLQKQLTQRNDITGAIAVRQEKGRILAELKAAGVEAPPPSPTASATGPSASRPPVIGRKPDWDALPFPKDSNWYGSRGQAASIDPKIVILRGRPIRTRQSFYAPMVFECDMELKKVGEYYSDGALWIWLIPEDAAADRNPQTYATVAFGYNRQNSSGTYYPTGTKHPPVVSREGGHVSINDTDVSGQAFSIKVDKPYHLKLEIAFRKLKVTIDDNTYESTEVNIPSKRFRIYVQGWQPSNTWSIRDSVIH